MTGDVNPPSKMSPASQGSLEVERYIGSCLISHSSRGKNKNKKPGSQTVNRSENSGGRKGANYKGDRRSVVSTHCSVHDVGTYASLLPVCDCTCAGFKFVRPNYGDRGNGWAGMPLISMTTSRRNKKTNGNNSGNRCIKGSSPPPPSSLSNPSSQFQSSKNNNDLDVANDKFQKAASHGPRTPLTHLAIHTQGVPLILASRFGGRKNSQKSTGMSPARLLRGGDLVLTHTRNGQKVGISQDGTTQKEEISKQGPRVHAPYREKLQQIGREDNVAASNTTPSSDCLSVASDESSGHSENSLPRIIKPRKRRKKDRKPIKPGGETASGLCETSSIVTLKPYVPLCYDFNNHSTHEDAEEISTVRSDENYPPPSLAAESFAVHPVSIETSTPKLVENPEELDSSTAYPYPPSSLCQCRYCDPAGLIWDIDQHCYSPFLTPPPSPSDISFSRSPFASIPLFLSPPAETLQGFKDSFFDGLFKGDGVFSLHPELRRSKSEPFGQAVEVEIACDKLQNRSHGLEVSTEIITSPNGHRDIEIRFYSPVTKPEESLSDVIPSFNRAPGESNSVALWNTVEVAGHTEDLEECQQSSNTEPE